VFVCFPAGASLKKVAMRRTYHGEKVIGKIIHSIDDLSDGPGSDFKACFQDLDNGLPRLLQQPLQQSLLDSPSFNTGYIRHCRLLFKFVESLREAKLQSRPDSILTLTHSYTLSECIIDLERSDKTRMCMSIKETVDHHLIDLVKAFWGRS